MTAEDADQCTECVIIDDILQCYQCLSKLSSLEPSPTVNRLFGKLVQLCSSRPLDEATVAVVGPSTVCCCVAKPCPDDS